MKVTIICTLQKNLVTNNEKNLNSLDEKMPSTKFGLNWLIGYGLQLLTGVSDNSSFVWPENESVALSGFGQQIRSRVERYVRKASL